jgi:V/A-type H+-transporting ATPase subunit I
VRFFDLPRAGALDPSALMAVFLPLLFGAMVGDVGYGVGLLALAWWVDRRFRPRSPLAGDLARVLAWSAGWAIVFGALYGEFLGSVGRELFGMPALWFYRGGENALEPLLLFALAIGLTHILLGLGLGAWQSWRDRHRGELAERLGTLAFLVGLLALVAAATERLPANALGPAVAAMLIGAAAAVAAHGPMGAVIAPLGLIGVLGNVLSYLRVAAVGLASVYLAVVANEFAAQTDLLLGVVIAAVFHALNLALAAFSPFIQSLRLHYVEFFSKFHAGGGRAFRAFGEAAPVAAPSRRPNP